MSDIRKKVFQKISDVVSNHSVLINNDLLLLENSSFFDSMKLVELCLALEDLADEIGFIFDWTSDAVMSRSRSMFKTAGTLSAEFEMQMSLKK